MFWRRVRALARASLSVRVRSAGTAARDNHSPNSAPQNTVTHWLHGIHPLDLVPTKRAKYKCKKIQCHKVESGRYIAISQCSAEMSRGVVNYNPNLALKGLRQEWHDREMHLSMTGLVDVSENQLIETGNRIHSNNGTKFYCIDVARIL
ncbi:unnamed protein product [Chrysodeixis includens]|uniref:Uncharacterized protein n=1 Tax=Chrysodeixis includens TaxID=689277 RepID=A0A9N8KYH9_CHRIL|nr:unnamed protein product [Chrysodeixis includens]